jgi:hypothetical protein
MNDIIRGCMISNGGGKQKIHSEGFGPRHGIATAATSDP